MYKIYTPTFQQMRLFESVARHQSITRAAEALLLSQPTVSMQIKAMEDKIGVPLFERIGRKLFLTREGEVVLAAAGDILARIEAMETNLKFMHQEVAGPLSLAVVSTAKYFLPQLLGQFKHLHPHVEPRLEITNRETVLTRLAQNADDFYIMGQPPEEQVVTAEPFMENVIVFVAPRNHPLCGQQRISISDLSKSDIIGREQGSGTRKAVEKIFQEHGCQLRVHMEFDDAEAIKQAVISELGVAYLSKHAIRLELQAGALCVLEVEGFPLRRQWYAMHHPAKTLSQTAQSFLNFITQK